MSRKTRKLIWSAPLVAVLAVAGALAIFAAATPGGVFADALPGAPMNLTAEADGWYAIDLDWDPPSSGAPDGYRIDMSEDGFLWETVVMDTGNSRTSYTDEDKLKADTNRHYRVFALNFHGAGRVSNPTSATTDVSEAPKAVTRLDADNIGQDKIELSWTDPTDTGGLDIVQYCIRWSADIDTMPTVCEVDSAGVTLVDAEEATSPSCFAEPAGDVSMGTYIDTDLDPNTTRHYEIVVITRKAVDQSASNPAVTVLESEASDTAVDTTDGAEDPGAPTSLTAVPIAGSMINLYWYSPEETGGADITGYRVEVKEDGARWPDASTTATRVDTNTGTYSYETASDNAVFRTVAPGENTTEVLQFELTATNIPMDEDADKELEIRVFAENGDATDNPDGAPPTSIRTSTSSSKPVSVTPTTDVERPAAPTVAASMGLDGQINVTITPPDAGATAYRIDSSKNGRDWELEVSDTRFTRFANNVYEDVNLGSRRRRGTTVRSSMTTNGRDVGIAAISMVNNSPEPGMTKAFERARRGAKPGG